MMPSASQFHPPDSFVDPRTQIGFQSEHWPLYNGGDSPAIGASEVHERRCLELLAAYYKVNQANADLIAARTSGAPEAAIKKQLNEVARALEGVDEIEDRYAPIGFYGEPVMDGIMYRDIHFVRPQLPRVFGRPESFSSHLAIPGLEEIPASELKGTPTVVRWDNGKMDL